MHDNMTAIPANEGSEVAHSANRWGKNSNSGVANQIQKDIQILELTHLGERRRKSGSAGVAHIIATDIQVA